MINYKICTKCVMDTSHLPEISFDENGICNYCRNFEKFKIDYLQKLDKKSELEKVISKLKSEGKEKKYDCILGLSGGVDSSYLCLKLKEFGLRTLLVQVDNGWNTELASNNIQRLSEYTGFDLITIVLDWEEFSDIQLSFFKASLKNIEAISDHAVIASLFKVARKHKIKNLIVGVNYQTEFTSSKMYGHSYMDLVQIKAVQKEFGARKMKTYPQLPFLWKQLIMSLNQINYITILNFMEYNKSVAIQELIEKANWKPYPGKHFESTITIFHQSFYLIEKYKLDKRRLHLSDLIRTQNCTRETALFELEQPSLDAATMEEIIGYVAKKLKLSKDEFLKIVFQEPKDYKSYPNYDYQRKIFYLVYSTYNKIVNLWKK